MPDSSGRPSVDARGGRHSEDIALTRLGGTGWPAPVDQTAGAGVLCDKYRLHECLGVGPDGAAYRATTQDATWEVRRLDNARRNAARWESLSNRLILSALLPPHRSMIATQVDLRAEPPLVALAWSDRKPLAVFLQGVETLENDRLLTNMASLADAVAAAHRLGLTHGALSVDTVFIEPNGSWTIEFTGAACRGAAPARPLIDDPYEDIHALGRLLARVLPLVPGVATMPGGRPTGFEFVDAVGMEAMLHRLASEMTAGELSDRPLAAEIAHRLIHLSDQFHRRGHEATQALEGDGPSAWNPPPLTGGAAALTAIGVDEVLGRYRLVAKLGEGGMGAVYRAIDEKDGADVAVKVLSGQRAASESARRRFIKEGRMLAQIQSPHVTQLIDANEDRGRFYLVMEYVQGRNLSQLMNEVRQFDEKRALELVADAARGLAAAHSRRIIHRDVKPENILIVESGARVTAKMTDFGLAREIVQSESLQITRAGTILGTPLYMAPEQFSGSEAEDPRTDVYALGATLFHLIAGRPPFTGQSFQELLTQHTMNQAPDLAKIAPKVSGSVVEIVKRALQKKPADRYIDAEAMLGDLELALHGQPTSLNAHPHLPQTPAEKVVTWEFRWELASSPAQLWPHVSNTERVNRAMGLPAVAFSAMPRELGGSRRHGTARVAGLRLSWEEHPFEWVEGRRMGVLREFTSGPFIWFQSVIDFFPRADGGTTLVQTIRIEPRGVTGRIVGTVEIGFKARRSLDAIYRRIDATLRHRDQGDALSDPFDRPTQLPGARQRRLWQELPVLLAECAAPDAADCLGIYLSNASPQEVARIRPIALARRFKIDADAMIAACLRAVHHGILVLRWEVLCPLCQLAATHGNALKDIKEHEHCPACNVDFATDLNAAVEMVFNVHPDIREPEFGTYCAGGPAHSPHVAAQTRVAAGERLELALNLSSGRYRLRGPQLPWCMDIEVAPTGSTRRLEINLCSEPDVERMAPLLPDGQTLVLQNPGMIELIARLERTVPRDDVVTAAQAMAMPLFRELFPGDMLAPDRLSQISSVSVLMTQLADGPSLFAQLGDGQAYSLINRSFEIVAEVVRQQRGVVVKTVSEGILAVFGETTRAAKAALRLQTALESDAQTKSLRIRAALHRGLATIASHEGRLDYFGVTIKEAIKLLENAGAKELVVSDAVALDPEVDAVFRRAGLAGQLLDVWGLAPQSRILTRRFALPASLHSDSIVAQGLELVAVPIQPER